MKKTYYKIVNELSEEEKIYIKIEVHGDSKTRSKIDKANYLRTIKVDEDEFNENTLEKSIKDFKVGLDI